MVVYAVNTFYEKTKAAYLATQDACMILSRKQ